MKEDETEVTCHLTVLVQRSDWKVETLLQPMRSFRMHAVIQSRMQTTGMIGSCRERQWNVQSKSTTARSVVDHQCITTRANSLHPPPPKIKSNRRFNALAKEVQNTFVTNHKKQPLTTRIRCGHNKQSEATRSIFARLCSSVDVSYRVLPFVTRRWQPHTNSIPGCFIRPHIHTWKLEWSNYVNTSAHSAAGYAALWCAATLTNFLHKLTK